MVRTVKARHTLHNPTSGIAAPVKLRPAEQAIMSIVEQVVYARKRIEAQHHDLVHARGWNKYYP